MSEQRDCVCLTLSRPFLCKVDMLTFCPSLLYIPLSFPAGFSRSRGTNVKGKEALCLATSMPLFLMFQYHKVSKKQKINHLIIFPFILVVKFL